jgi:hypothetical protein
MYFLVRQFHILLLECAICMNVGWGCLRTTNYLAPCPASCNNSNQLFPVKESILDSSYLNIGNEFGGKHELPPQFKTPQQFYTQGRHHEH